MHEQALLYELAHVITLYIFILLLFTSVHFRVVFLVQVFAEHPSLQEQFLHVLNQREGQIVGQQGQKDDANDRQPHRSPALQSANHNTNYDMV